MSHHRVQIAAALRRAVQEVLSRGLHDPRVRGLISVTTVEVSDDLADACVCISILPAEHAELTLHGLRHAAAHIRSQTAARVPMRRLPRLSFRLDQSLKKEAAVFAAIAEGRSRDGDHAPAAEPAPAAPPQDSAAQDLP